MTEYAWNSKVNENLESYIDENELMRILKSCSQRGVPSIHTIILTIGVNKDKWLKFRELNQPPQN